VLYQTYLKNFKKGNNPYKEPLMRMVGELIRRSDTYATPGDTYRAIIERAKELREKEKMKKFITKPVEPQLKPVDKQLKLFGTRVTATERGIEWNDPPEMSWKYSGGTKKERKKWNDVYGRRLCTLPEFLEIAAYSDSDKQLLTKYVDMFCKKYDVSYAAFQTHFIEQKHIHVMSNYNYTTEYKPEHYNTGAGLVNVYGGADSVSKMSTLIHEIGHWFQQVGYKEDFEEQGYKDMKRIYGKPPRSTTPNAWKKIYKVPTTKHNEVIWEWENDADTMGLKVEQGINPADKIAVEKRIKEIAKSGGQSVREIRRLYDRYVYLKDETSVDAVPKTARLSMWRNL
jgi:hypothetical protein